MQTTIIGYPRISLQRELKFASEKYFRGEITARELEETAKLLRAENRTIQQKAGLDMIPSGDFSFYDSVLDMAVLLNAVPARYADLGLSPLDTYFAMARGYQGIHGDVKALAMKKWFHTNYHYMVPELDDDTHLKLSGTKPFDLFQEAKDAGVIMKPTLIGAYTFLKLARCMDKKTAVDFADEIAEAYGAVLEKLACMDAQWIQLEEPYLVKDTSEADKALFLRLYEKILSHKGGAKILLQTYFGDVRDSYSEILSLDFDGIGLDFVEGKESLALVERCGFPSDKILFAGVVSGKNIWRNHYASTLEQIERLKKVTSNLVLNTSSSLLHVPYTLRNETQMEEMYRKHFAYAEEKLTELAELKVLAQSDEPTRETAYQRNAALFSEQRGDINPAVQERVRKLTNADFVRTPEFAQREKIQKERFHLPLLPTTTIGSFPQTSEVRAARAVYRKGTMTQEQYNIFLKEKIADCVREQEEIGLDVLVHGEFERNDMVEYFGENLSGYLFIEKAWIQSYGTRCVKPPIIWGDISRAKPMTVAWSKYAQSLTKKPMKGMLTGPVTILNWSFPREDISLRESAFQIALAIRDEVLDLEANGISIIQVDEAALREKLPL